MCCCFLQRYYTKPTTTGRSRLQSVLGLKVIVIIAVVREPLLGERRRGILRVRALQKHGRRRCEEKVVGPGRAAAADSAPFSRAESWEGARIGDPAVSLARPGALGRDNGRSRSGAVQLVVFKRQGRAARCDGARGRGVRSLRGRRRGRWRRTARYRRRPVRHAPRHTRLVHRSRRGE